MTDQCLTPGTPASPSLSSSSSIGMPPLQTVPKADLAWQFKPEKVRAKSLTTTTGLFVLQDRQELPNTASEESVTTSNRP